MVVKIICFLAGAMFGFVMASVICAASRADEWENRKVGK